MSNDRARREATRIIAIANQKGGVGKTTTALNLGAALAEAGQKVLLLDLDPQGNASTGLGVAASDRHPGAWELLMGAEGLPRVARETGVPGLRLVPASPDLSAADVELVSHEKRVFMLRDALRRPGAQALDLDYLLIDCPPSLNLLTVNAMVAAGSVLVPLQAEFFALEGLSQLMLTMREIRAAANPMLRTEGIVLTMYDMRNNLCREVESDARATLGDLVFRTVIPRNVRLSEAPSHAMTVLDYDPHSRGAEAYRALARELLALHRRAPAPAGEGEETTA